MDKEEFYLKACIAIASSMAGAEFADKNFKDDDNERIAGAAIRLAQELTNQLFPRYD